MRIQSKLSFIHCAKPLFVVIWLGILMMPASFSLAKDYKVEVIVFEHLTEHSAFEPSLYSEPVEMPSNADTWKIPPTMLNEEAQVLQRSEDYRLINYFSWGQEALPYSESAAYEIKLNNLNGWIKVYAGHLLFSNIDLDFDGYRMTQKRRLKLNEKHFFDHPKFGILMQVSRLEDEETETEEIN